VGLHGNCVQRRDTARGGGGAGPGTGGLLLRLSQELSGGPAEKEFSHWTSWNLYSMSQAQTRRHAGASKTA